MTSYLPVFAALAVGLMGSALVPSLKASERDQKTMIGISQPVVVERTILPAVQCVLKLSDFSFQRDLVYIFNGDGTRLITVVLAIHATRPLPTNKTVFSPYNSPPGQPTALHTWFYPGADNGLELVQPQYTATAKSSAALEAPGKATRSLKPAAAAESGAGGN
jgi:hypothetical protein